MKLLYSFVPLFLLFSVNGSPDDSPICDTAGADALIQRSMGSSATAPKVTLTSDKTSYAAGDSLSLTLTADSNFAGLLLYAAPSSDPKKRAGSFQIPANFQNNKKHCPTSETDSSVITHKQSQSYDKVQKFSYTASKTVTGDLKFSVILVKKEGNGYSYVVVDNALTIKGVSGAPAAPAAPAGLPVAAAPAAPAQAAAGQPGAASSALKFGYASGVKNTQAFAPAPAPVVPPAPIVPPAPAVSTTTKSSTTTTKASTTVSAAPAANSASTPKSLGDSQKPQLPNVPVGQPIPQVQPAGAAPMNPMGAPTPAGSTGPAAPMNPMGAPIPAGSIESPTGSNALPLNQKSNQPSGTCSCNVPTVTVIRRCRRKSTTYPGPTPAAAPAPAPAAPAPAAPAPAAPAPAADPMSAPTAPDAPVPDAPVPDAPALAAAPATAPGPAAPKNPNTPSSLNLPAALGGNTVAASAYAKPPCPEEAKKAAGISSK